jgi:hypothetical protein
MKVKEEFSWALVVVCGLSGCSVTPVEPGTYDTYVEVVAPASEVSRLTTLFASEPKQIAFMSLDDKNFDNPVKDLTITPGCRCACMMVNMQSFPQLIPICIATSPGHTYIVSSTMGFNSSIWVNEWESSAIPAEVSLFDLPKLTRRKSAMFDYKFKPDGKFIPTSRSPILEFCALPQTSCMPPVQ